MTLVTVNIFHLVQIKSSCMLIVLFVNL